MTKSRSRAEGAPRRAKARQVPEAVKAPKAMKAPKASRVPRAPKAAAASGARKSAARHNHLLGHQIRDLRRSKGVTIPQLAARIDRSVGWLSQIERGISEVTIAALHQIAEALGVQVSWFFGQGAAPPADEIGLVLRKRNRRTLDFHGSGVHEEILSPNLSGQLLLVETTFAPGASTGDRDRERHGEEAGLVISGTLELRVEGKTLRLESGDSFAFTRKGPHRCHNPGKIPALVLWVITPPSY